MSVIDIVKDFGIPQAEEAFQKVADSKDTTLRLPLKLSKPKFGARSALIQLIITWAKQSKTRGIKTYLGSGVSEAGISEQFFRMRDQGFGMIAGLLANNIAGATGEDLTERCKTHLLKYLTLTHEKMNSARTTTRRMMLCADHLGLRYHPLLYTGFAEGVLPTVAPDEDMASIVYEFIDFAIKYKGSYMLSPAKKVFPALGGILHELFENTNDWAKPPATSDEISLRGILLESYIQFPSSPENALDWIKDGGPLEDYANNLTNRGAIKRSFIEISIFDSGPGIAQRWLQTKYNDPQLFPKKETQYDAVITAFRRWSTSSENAGRGKGLDRVLRLLTNLRGFFYLRTDNLALYRDLANDPHKTEDYNSTVINPGKVPLKDWQSKGQGLSDLPRVEGVLICMLIPLDTAME